MAIQKAVRYQRKLRAGGGGPTGAGKTFTFLTLATYIAEKTGARVGLIDTENFSSSIYADEFDFDVSPLSDFSPDSYIKAIEEFERAETPYVLVVDSLSHAWIGKGGALDQVDQKVLKGADSFTAWRTVSPQHNRLVDKLINYDGHLFVTLRAKMEHALEKDDRTGKNKVVKLGMAPVMRDGIEYEMDVYFDIDQDHNLSVSKSRFRSIDGYSVNKAGIDLAEKLWQATQGAEPPPKPEPPAPAAQPNPSQLGDFGTPEGKMNEREFVAYLTSEGLKTGDLAGIVPKGTNGGLNINGYLVANPEKTLMSLVEEAKAAKAAQNGAQPALVG